MLQSRRKLRSRIFVSFALFGLGLSALFAVASVYIRAKVENQLIDDQLQRDVDSMVSQVRKDPTHPPGTTLVEPWIFSKRKEYNIPFAWQGLDTGVHDVVERDEKGRERHYKLAVRRDQDLIGFLRYDVTRDELGKRQLTLALAVAVVLFGVLSLLIASWLSWRIIQPVTDLARRLRLARRIGKLEPLAHNFADDEVGELATALDDYAKRLTDLVQRDREFNADVSHELRTPLAVISTTTELLLNTPDLSDKMRDRLKRMERASRQSTELIEALLLLSRAERSGPIDGETTDIAKVCADVIDANRPHLGGRPVEVGLRVESPLAVNAPSSVVAVALNNLIGNAIKYTPQGEVVVRVQDGRVLVEDTGPGIKAEDAEKLFQRGVRGEGAAGKGAGLGLAIVRRLCELYGWSVSLRPREGGGAVATLDFRGATSSRSAT